ncbi:transcription initiation factor TFIID subunit 4-like [Falco cherrug]|uniref:transcription initiation factor TFIID subunit 4-like n=1 Tax=Falco cherrug TaxID=345164 RepID=UPI0024786CE0|nr:transcription initiation factor TFIID subunit 4-like [Falco cherrug]
MLVRPSGMRSMGRRPRARRTMASQWDKPAGAVPMLGPTGGRPTRQELPVHRLCSLPSSSWELAGPAGSCQPCPAPGADGRLHLSHPPTPQRPRGSLAETPRLWLIKPEPAFLQGSAGKAPEPSWVAGQDFGSWCPSSPGDAAASSAGARWVRSPCRALAPHTTAAHVLRDSSPPDGLMLQPYINPKMFLSKSNSLEHPGTTQLLCWGCSSARGSRVGVKHGFPGKPAPPSLWISCGFVVSPKHQRATWHLQMKTCTRACAPSHAPHPEPHLPTSGQEGSQPRSRAPGHQPGMPRRTPITALLARPPPWTPISRNASLPSRPILSPPTGGGGAGGAPLPGGGLAGAQRSGEDASVLPPGTLAPTKGLLLPQSGLERSH